MEPQAEQITGIGTLGSVSKMTAWLSSPVGIGSFVLGHLVRIGAIAVTRNNPRTRAALSAQRPAAQARSVRIPMRTLMRARLCRVSVA